MPPVLVNVGVHECAPVLYPYSVTVLCWLACVHTSLYLRVYVYECIYCYSHLGSY